MLSSLGTWFLVKLSTTRRESLFRMKMELRLSTECGTLSVLSWQLLFSVVLITFTLNLVLKFCTLVLLLEPQSLMCLILLDPRDVSTRLSFLTEVVEIW
uniref:Uncharacterized protein n=1 Tax=Brassica oleracea TaxID=3712 RepID=A0A3P6FCB5_BRAOL|nr:unnamed protein product [Brassica oleracea]